MGATRTGRGVVGVLELAHHVAEGAHLAVAQVFGGVPVQSGDLVKGDLGDVLGEVSVLDGEEIPVIRRPEDGQGDQGTHQTHRQHQEDDDSCREALGLNEPEILPHPAVGVDLEAGVKERTHHKHQAQQNEKEVEVAVLEIQGGEGEIKIDQAEYQCHQQAGEDTGSLALWLARFFCVHNQFLIQIIEIGSGHLGLDSGLSGLHGLKGQVQQLVQVPAQQLSPLLDDLPGAPGGELLVLEFFLQGLELHV